MVLGLISISLASRRTCMSLLICLTDNAVALFVQLLLFGFHLGFQRSNFLLVLLNFTTLIFDSHTTALQRTEDILKRFVLFTDLFFGLVDDVVWKTKLGGNGKCVTLPGTPISRR